jgi:heme/copper-type cytochrome/quinol oxidase subunit 2
VVAIAATTALTVIAGEGLERQSDTRREFTIVAKRYAFEPAVIEVHQDDLVKITLRSADIPHSFTLDRYRIAKRVGAGGSTTFEFRAHEAGTFVFYCNLKLEDGCRDMRGRLIVTPRD